MALSASTISRQQVGKLRDRLRDLRVFRKILIANTFLVALGTVLGYWLTRHLAERTDAWWTILVGITSVGVSLLLNSIILRAALSSIEPLRETVEQVRQGNPAARAARPFFGDPDLRRLGDTLNALLDTVQTQQEELETQLRRVQALSGAVIRAQEQERQRIALELHDEASQALTAIIVGHRVIQQLDDVDAIKRKSCELRDLTSDTLDALHRLIIELRPSLLEERGLLPALRWYAGEYGQRFGIKPDLCTAGFEGRLPREVETVLFRIVQEALTNVARHADARHICVRLLRQQGRIEASIEDDGRGFMPPAGDAGGSPARGLGLLGMQERAALVAGCCTVHSGPGCGTRVLVTIPEGKPPVDGGGESDDQNPHPAG
jgi:two-component system sensor histidine kinase UhpB